MVSLRSKKGFGIIEALIGITIGALLLTALSTLIVQTMKINRVNALNIKAMMYLQEMIEVAKDMEQSATTTIFFDTGSPSPCTNCHPTSTASGIWGFGPGTETLEGFTRSMTISPVSRDITSHEIEVIYNLVNDDPYTKMATATITWYDGSQNRTSKLETYLYYYGQ